jgi:D-sedoheptulose 7-phosphate isomerase
MDKTEKKAHVLSGAVAAVELRQQLIQSAMDDIIAMASGLAKTLRKGGTIYLAGNGGSAADCDHFATELVIRLSSAFDRPSLPAVSLSANSSLLTAAGNDYGFEKIFSRQVESLIGKKDLLFIISTSGNSVNLLRAAEIARRRGIPIFALLGFKGGKLKKYTDQMVIVPSDSVQRIQEEHIFIIHNLVELLERDLF